MRIVLPPLSILCMLLLQPSSSFVIFKRGHLTLSPYIYGTHITDYSHDCHSKSSFSTLFLITTKLFCQLLGMNCASESQFLVNFWSTQYQQRQRQLQNLHNNKESIRSSVSADNIEDGMTSSSNHQNISTSSWLLWNDFCQRGGKTDIHSDGWGLAYYIGNGIRQFHDIEAASTSLLAEFIGRQPITTRNLLAHIRYATSGAVNMANVHPFTREMWAVNWCFCHNGHVPLFIEHPEYDLGRSRNKYDIDQQLPKFYYPVGDTDSEATFCAILNALRFKFNTTMPSLPVLYDEISLLCKEIVDFNPKETIFNFLLTCGPHVLWVYSWPGKRPNSSVWNGLHYMVKDQSVSVSDEDINVRVSVKHQRNNGRAATKHHDSLNAITNNNICIVATKPFTNDEDWIELQPGELIVLDEGIPHVTPTELFRIELQGRGINNEKKILSPPRLQEDMRRYSINPEFFIGGGI